MSEGPPTYPYPPSYSSGAFNLATPFVISPTILLALIVILGGGRYLQTRSNSVRLGDFSTVLGRLNSLSKLIFILCLFIVGTFVVDALIIVGRALFSGKWTSTVLAYYVAVSWLAWTLSLALLIDETHKSGRWHWVQYIFWASSAIMETSVAWLWMVGTLRPQPGAVFSVYDRLLLAVFITRYVLEVTVFVTSMIHMFSQNTPQDAEPLLGFASVPSGGYGSLPSQAHPLSADKSQGSSFNDFFSKLMKVLPYVWPSQDKKLQLMVLLCFLLILSSLVINVFTPLQIGKVVDQMEGGSSQFAWAAVMAYVGLRFLQGGSGLIQALQNWLWIPVGQYTTREISISMFSHLHNLSLGFHINRKTGEVLRVMDRGTNSVVQLLQQILFQIFPALANILIACFVFAIRFSFPFGAIVFITMSLYLFATITLTEWRTQFRREMNTLDNYARSKAVDSLLNFETVKYYGAESFEVSRYKNAIAEYQKADWKCSVSLNVLNLAQNAVITAGLLAGSLLFAWEVSKGTLTAGDFVAFNMYMMQLYTPLHFFGTYYRMIQQNFIDMEKMLELFEVEQTVKDVSGAKDLKVTEGHVVFDNVTFGYDQRQTALNGISFSIPKGATVALVGPSGGGKSTIMRLLFRFYDPQSGNIYVDGQNISRVTQASLRHSIGVVPQDTVLFNDTILYNIRYGSVTASDQEVFKAAEAARIHEKILSFPDGYETKVGERGLRLSGGEKQRVAIARTILKGAPIILLDEATSALDTSTERRIQEALADMTKNRTTLVIAHRLSTIVNADLILVVKDGQVVESGTHDELIKLGITNGRQGVYYEMWEKQLNEKEDDSLDSTEDNASTLDDATVPTSNSNTK